MKVQMRLRDYFDLIYLFIILCFLAVCVCIFIAECLWLIIIAVLLFILFWFVGKIEYECFSSDKY